MTSLSKEDLKSFEKDLRAAVKGGVSFDEVTRGIYSTDASIYQIQPIAVVMPHDEEEVCSAVRIAVQYGVPILPRGGGTSLAGQTVGAALVIDFSRHMTKVLEVNPEERWVRLQPGVVRDELNAQLAHHNLHYAPDPATANRANFGGMIGNNSSGTRSILYGKAVDHVLETRNLLADGTILDFKELSPEEYANRCEGESREALLYRRVKRIIEENRDEIEARFPKVMRRVGGYNLDEFIHTDRWNLSKLVTGSEGTLCTLLDAKVNLEPLPKETSVCVLHFNDLLETIRSVEPILEHGPSAVEILDKTVLDLARQNLSIAPLCDFLEGDPTAVLIVEFYGDSKEEVAARAERMSSDISGKGFGYAYPVMLDPGSKAKVWNVRKNGLGIMLGLKGDKKPTPFIEDACIPVHVLPEYIEKVLKLCHDLEVDVAMYAHASVGVIHVRPILDLRQRQDIENMVKISEQAFELVKHYEGSWCGEHGDGLVRSPYMERFFGPKIYAAFREVKNLFDPQGLMNPGKIIDAPPMDQNLRYGTSYRGPSFETVFKYREDGGFASAVEMCTGVGACRKSGVGTMCPSYMATRDEQHCTRGRANALRLAMTGQLGPEGMTSDSLYEVLDLCLSCKACKSECPSNVDMAKLKGEFLQQYRDRHGVSLRDTLIGRSADAAARISGWKASLVNRLQETSLFKAALQAVAGFDKRRSLPRYAEETLVSWFFERSEKGSGEQGKVVLFADTYINHHEPRIGRAAVELLESCGYEVLLADVGCCQRPRISHGFLRDAKEKGTRTAKALEAYLGEGRPVVVCEPSCCSALTDDLPDLIEDEKLANRLRQNVKMIDVFLAEEVDQGKLNRTFVSDSERILIHGHCHQKALYGTAAMKKLLGRVENLVVEEIDSGCCGMAGSFGYEKEHYDLSRLVAHDRLLPTIEKRAPNATLVACGFSCRHQIADFAGARAVHWVETLRARKNGG